MRTINKPKSATGHRVNYTKSNYMSMIILVDRFKSLHNSGRFVNNPSTNPQQSHPLYQVYQPQQLYQQPKMFNPVRAWGDSSSSMTNGTRMSK